MKAWQHDETGRVTNATERPGPRWAEVPPAYSERVACQSCKNGSGPHGCTDCLNTGRDFQAFANGMDQALNDAYAEGRKDEAAERPWTPTARDYFAAHAMAGLLAQPNFHPIHNAAYCYEVADAMLDAREGPA